MQEKVPDLVRDREPMPEHILAAAWHRDDDGPVDDHDREGVDGPGDVSIVGNEASVTAQLERLAEIGATDFVAIPSGTDDDRRRTLDHLATLSMKN